MPALTCLLVWSASPLPVSAADPVLLAAEGGPRIVLGGARAKAVMLAVPEGAEMVRLARVSAGWVAGGSSPTTAGRRLLLIQELHGVRSSLPPPAAQSGSDQSDPVPLVRRGSLAGVAWLEGRDARSAGVRSAVWDGAGWQRTQVVSEPGPGSQIALSGTVLADGSWLLVWSFFDGHDDEILWSRREKEYWSPPRRLGSDNSVPDITPAVVASDAGALVAWSRYDGSHYRLVLSRFDGHGWSKARTLGGRGSFSPSWHQAQGGSLHLLFRDGQARGWQILELDDRGGPRRTSLALGPPGERPALQGDAQEAILWWPDGRSTPVAWRTLSLVDSADR